MNKNANIQSPRPIQLVRLALFVTATIIVLLVIYKFSGSKSDNPQIQSSLVIPLEKNAAPAVIQLRSPGEKARTAKNPIKLCNQCTVLVDVRNPGVWLRSRLRASGSKNLDPLLALLPNMDSLSARLDAADWFDSRTEKKEYDKLKDLLDSRYNLLIKDSNVNDEEQQKIKRKISELINRSRERHLWEPMVEQYMREARLVLNGAILNDLQPKMESYWEEWEELKPPQGEPEETWTRYRTLRFDVAITSENKSEWKKLLCDLGFGIKPLEVSLAFPQLFGQNLTEIMPTEVVPTAPNNWNKAEFALARDTSQIVLGIIFAALLGVFVYCAVRTNLLCVLDESTGFWHFSLGFCQMACWFFVISICYVFLWIALGDAKTLSNKELLLLGITTTSSLGSFLVFGKGATKGLDSENLKPDVLTPEQLKSRSAKEFEKWLSIAENRQPPCEEECRELKKRLDYYKGDWKAKFHRILYDLLSEANNGIPSFHRYQLIGWTVTFVFIFIRTVYHDLAMPEFSAEQLVLIGISNGTYLGFKWKDNNSSNESNKQDKAPEIAQLGLHGK